MYLSAQVWISNAEGRCGFEGRGGFEGAGTSPKTAEEMALGNKGKLGSEVHVPEEADDAVLLAQSIMQHALQAERARTAEAQRQHSSESSMRDRAERERDALADEVKRLHERNASLAHAHERVLETLSARTSESGASPSTFASHECTLNPYSFFSTRMTKTAPSASFFYWSAYTRTHCNDC